jgi:phage-related protein
LAVSKNLGYVGGSLKELLSQPKVVQQKFAQAIDAVAAGATDFPGLRKWLGKYRDTDEIKVAFSGDAFRCVITTRIEGNLFVLHAFKKKSHVGSKTPKEHIDLIEMRQKLLDVSFKQVGK